MKIYKNTEYPKKDQDLKGVELEHSVDVITIDCNDMLNIGWWNYDTKKWSFHTETLVDYYEGEKLRDFVWIYRPNELIVKKAIKCSKCKIEINQEDFEIFGGFCEACSGAHDYP